MIEVPLLEAHSNPASKRVLGSSSDLERMETQIFYHRSNKLFWGCGRRGNGPEVCSWTKTSFSVCIEDDCRNIQTHSSSNRMPPFSWLALYMLPHAPKRPYVGFCRVCPCPYIEFVHLTKSLSCLTTRKDEFWDRVETEPEICKSSDTHRGYLTYFHNPSPLFLLE